MIELAQRVTYGMDTELYRVEERPSRVGMVLVHALTGFVDAGQAGHLAVAHLLENLEHRLVATFDIDQLLDYRSRRPMMIFDEDRWAGYEQPELVQPVKILNRGDLKRPRDNAPPDIPAVLRQAMGWKQTTGERFDGG